MFHYNLFWYFFLQKPTYFTWAPIEKERGNGKWQHPNILVFIKFIEVMQMQWLPIIIMFMPIVILYWFVVSSIMSDPISGV